MLLRFVVGALLATWVMACAIEPNPSPLTEGGAPASDQSPGVDSPEEPDKGGDGMGTTDGEFETGGGGDGAPAPIEDVSEPGPDVARAADTPVIEEDAHKEGTGDAVETDGPDKDGS